MLCTVAKVEAEIEVKEDKKVVEAKIPTKANKMTRSLMTQTGACKEEVTLVAGRAREDAEIKGSLIRMQTVVPGHVENQITMHETVLGKNKEIEGNREIMHQAVIKLILKGCLLCSIWQILWLLLNLQQVRMYGLWIQVLLTI